VTCATCNGSGWKLVEQGGRSAVARCDCWRETLVDKLMTDAHIQRRYQHCDLERFKTYENATLVDAVARARSLAERFPVVSKGLFFIGPTGVGKTHLAVATLKQVIQKKSAHGLFYDTRELLRVIRETFDPVVRSTEREVLKPVIAAELLVLDDLGAERTTEWVDETLNYIVNTRYLERRLTIFTSNYLDVEDPTELNSLRVRVGFRMYSRLHEMCEFIHMEGADFRELPLNSGDEQMKNAWKARPLQIAERRATRASGGSLPASSSRQLRARRPSESIELKWSGGKAGT
jgi:DNA replication protein DnaC